MYIYIYIYWKININLKKYYNIDFTDQIYNARVGVY